MIKLEKWVWHLAKAPALYLIQGMVPASSGAATDLQRSIVAMNQPVAEIRPASTNRPSTKLRRWEVGKSRVQRSDGGPLTRRGIGRIELGDGDQAW